MAIAGKRIIIVGGTSGAGRASAQLLAQSGAVVTIAGRDRARLDAALAEMDGLAVDGCIADMTDDAALAALFAGVGGFDALVLAASSGVAWGPFATVTPAMLRRALDGKLIGYWATIQAALPYLHANGSITLMTGAAARHAIPGTAGLAAVNGAINRMAATLARELAPIRVNVISPGLIDTPAYDGLPATAKAELFAKTAATLAVGRTGLPAEIAPAVLFLVENGFTTGAVIDLDGGPRP